MGIDEENKKPYEVDEGSWFKEIEEEEMRAKEEERRKREEEELSKAPVINIDEFFNSVDERLESVKKGVKTKKRAIETKIRDKFNEQIGKIKPKKGGEEDSDEVGVERLEAPNHVDSSFDDIFGASSGGSGNSSNSFDDIFGVSSGNSSGNSFDDIFGVSKVGDTEDTNSLTSFDDIFGTNTKNSVDDYEDDYEDEDDNLADIFGVTKSDEGLNGDGILSIGNTDLGIEDSEPTKEDVSKPKTKKRIKDGIKVKTNEELKTCKSNWVIDGCKNTTEDYTFHKCKLCLADCCSEHYVTGGYCTDCAVLIGIIDVKALGE